MLPQVRSLVDVLPEIEVVEDDPFNSSPTDPKMMGPEALRRHQAGETLPAAHARTPLVELPLGATEDRICGAHLDPADPPRRQAAPASRESACAAQPRR